MDTFTFHLPGPRGEGKDREAEINGIVIGKRTWNNRTGRHKMKPGGREANKIDAGVQGTIGIQPGVRVKIGMEMAPNIQNTELPEK